MGVQGSYQGLDDERHPGPCRNPEQAGRGGLSGPCPVLGSSGHPRLLPWRPALSSSQKWEHEGSLGVGMHCPDTGGKCLLT